MIVVFENVDEIKSLFLESKIKEDKINSKYKRKFLICKKILIHLFSRIKLFTNS